MVRLLICAVHIINILYNYEKVFAWTLHKSDQMNKVSVGRQVNNYQIFWTTAFNAPSTLS
jgi:hypothetical protein